MTTVWGGRCLVMRRGGVGVFCSLLFSLLLTCGCRVDARFLADGDGFGMGCHGQELMSVYPMIAINLHRETAARREGLWRCI